MKSHLEKHPKLHILFQRVYFQFFKRHIFGITGPIRLLPDFIIIGTVRSGTTSLYSNICQHPCVLPAAYDELGFFDSNFHLGLNWYRSLFPTLFSKWIVKQKKQFKTIYDCLRNIFISLTWSTPFCNYWTLRSAFFL